MEIDWTRMCYNLVTLYAYTLHALYTIFQHIVISTQGDYRSIQNSLYRSTASLTYIFNIVNYIRVIPCQITQWVLQSSLRIT